jgi:antitoxin component HigA of HigAB toxin-antitoxin module
VGDREKREKNLEEAYRASLLRVLDTPDGRRVVWRALERAGVYRTTFCGEETHRSALLEGRRALGLELLMDLMETCPESYQLMQADQRREDSNGE